VLWTVFERVQDELDTRGLLTWPALYTRLAAHLQEAGAPPFDFVVVDEAQDVSVAQLRFLAALGGDRPDGLFLAGDLGQRIFQAPFSWKSLGVDVRGRSSTLRINYRTSHQIRARADLLLAPEVSDVDGNVESRRAVSVFNGPDPAVMALEGREEEVEAVARWLTERLSEGVEPHEIGIFVRSEAELPRATSAADAAGLQHRLLNDRVETASGYGSVGTMHLAKGLEFRAVVVMACDDEVIPSQERIEAVGDEADLEDSMAGSTFQTNPYDLFKLLEDCHRGVLQLPDFQRSWVWDEDRIKSLIASVSRAFPVGALMTLDTGGRGQLQAPAHRRCPTGCRVRRRIRYCWMGSNE
jgi:superfamily I DNA/RNA helicase